MSQNKNSTAIAGNNRLLQDTSRSVPQMVATAIILANTASVALDAGIANRVNAALASAYTNTDRRNDRAG